MSLKRDVGDVDPPKFLVKTMKVCYCDTGNSTRAVQYTLETVEIICKDQAHQVPSHQVPSHNVPAHVPVLNIPAHNLLAHSIPAHYFPAHNIPEHDIPAHDLPAQDVPAHNLGVASTSISTLFFKLIT